MGSKTRSRPLLGILVMSVLAAGIYYSFEHHWPNFSMLLGWIFGWIMTEAYMNIAKLMKRQNALLEQVLGVLKADRHEYEEPLGRM